MMDHADPYAQFTEEHLAVAVAVAGHATRDPTLALDIACEAIAIAYGNECPEDDARCAVLDAVEHVFRASIFNGSVPKRGRLRLGDPRPTMLSAAVRAGIMKLCREPLPAGSSADQMVSVLRRDPPSAAVLRQVQGSGLVRADIDPEHERAGEEPSA